MKRITIEYHPGEARTVVTGNAGTLEAIGILHMAINHLTSITKITPALEEVKQKSVLTEAQAEVLDRMPISEALTEAMEARFMKHPNRPKTMGDIARIPSHEFLRLPSMGDATISRAKAYFERFGYIWK